ncbi:DUF2730 family protein [Ensifer soli]|uniref:DUF2730 family protein n=1 Tax=Ciceribacter sp. sgz301302 TaxID=3342379 RepID=UPI0035B7157A
MDLLDNLKSWLGLLALVISVSSSVWVIISSSARKTASELETFQKRNAEEMKVLMAAVTELSKRTQSLESDMKHLPDAKAFMELRLAISELSGRLGRMEETQISTARTVMLVQDHLLKTSAA